MATDRPPPLSSSPARGGWRRAWRYGRALLAPLLVYVLLVAALARPVREWLGGQDRYDEEALAEWLEEARNHEKTLADMVDSYLEAADRYAEARAQVDRAPPPGDLVEGDRDLIALARQVLARREEIYQHLRALGEPPTKMYPGQLLLFPTINRLEVVFTLDEAHRAPLATTSKVSAASPIVWAAGLPGPEKQFKVKRFALRSRALVEVHYQLHAFNKRQREEQERGGRLRWLGVLALAATLLGTTWLVLLQNREREQERARLLAQHQVDQAERLLLRQERRHAETERQLLEQKLATQAAEQQALELKSHLYASIGIMAGSYAHNIKNLLVRPNDLLRRCLEDGESPGDRQRMLREVQQTLGTVTERLQQILQTVRRDPSHSELSRLELGEMLAGLAQTWRELAQDRWKLDLVLEQPAAPLEVRGDLSHLQQAVENLLFNARDATFEMRNHLRDAARKLEGGDPQARRRAVLEAAAWRGRVTVRARREGDEAVVEVTDNGAGMTEEVRRRCTETHFTTKRDNALYEGHSTGMGLGLSFVVAILEHHGAKLEIESGPLKGTTFRARFPLAREGEASRERERPEGAPSPGR